MKSSQTFLRSSYFSRCEKMRQVCGLVKISVTKNVMICAVILLGYFALIAGGETNEIKGKSTKFSD